MADFAVTDVIATFDERRDIAVPGDALATQHWCVEHFIACAQRALKKRGRFAVALSGGSTPRVIFQQLALPQNLSRVDWSRALIFWSDERAVPPDHADSNFRMAMEAGFSRLPIPLTNIFRMEAEEDIAGGALRYEEQIAKHVPDLSFDLVMLGMGPDGHVASLFPNTHALHAQNRRVVANYVPQHTCWRMTMTYEQINSAHAIAIYVIGKDKADTLAEVLLGPYDPERLPAQRVGTDSHKALWVADLAAAKGMDAKY